MTVAATPLLTGLPATLPARLGAGHGWERCLVVLLNFLRACADDGKPMRLLPFGWLSSPVLPLVGRGAWTAKDADKIRGGNIGESVLEGHGQILPLKKKCAMQKIKAGQVCAMHASCVCSNQPNQMTATNHSPRATVFFKEGSRFKARYQFATVENANQYIAGLNQWFRERNEIKVEIRPYSPIVKNMPERKRIQAVERTSGIEQAPCSRDLAWKESKQ